MVKSYIFLGYVKGFNNLKSLKLSSLTLSGFRLSGEKVHRVS